MSASSRPDRTRFVLVGAGKVGTAISVLLRTAGHEAVGVASRSRASAERAASRLETRSFESVEELPPADVVLIGAGESAIEEIARDVALYVVPGAVVVHFAGGSGLHPLQPVLAIGARGAALHPVQAMPGLDQAVVRLPGSAWGVTCPPDVRPWAHALIRDDLSGEPVDVREEDRPLWHAASVTTANGIAALLSAGERILESFGIEQPERVLGPLAAGTVTNAIEGGGGSATLTGPAVRGERATMEGHLEALRARAPDLVEAYALAAEIVLDGARAGNRMSVRDAEAVRSLLRRH